MLQQNVFIYIFYLHTFGYKFTQQTDFFTIGSISGVGNQKLLVLMTADVIDTSANLPPMSLRSREMQGADDKLEQTLWKHSKQ
jgi:hypothetical protein